METEYLTEREVSEMTGIKVATLRNHRHRRKGIPFIKHGSMVRYKIEDVRAYLDARRIDFNPTPTVRKKEARVKEPPRKSRTGAPEKQREKASASNKTRGGESKEGKPGGRRIGRRRFRWLV